MKSLQFKAFICLVLSYLRVELFEAFAPHLPLASKAASTIFGSWMSTVGSHFAVSLLYRLVMLTRTFYMSLIC